jgi:hypothetical protein
MPFSWLSPERCYQDTLARARRNGLTYDQQVELDEAMLRVYEAEVHLADVGFLAMALLNPAFLPLAAQAVLLSAWLAGTHRPLDALGDAVADAGSDLAYYPRALAHTAGCAAICGVALLLAGSMLATVLSIVYG